MYIGNMVVLIESRECLVAISNFDHSIELYRLHSAKIPSHSKWNSVRFLISYWSANIHVGKGTLSKQSEGNHWSSMCWVQFSHFTWRLQFGYLKFKHHHVDTFVEYIARWNADYSSRASKSNIQSIVHSCNCHCILFAYLLAYIICPFIS